MLVSVSIFLIDSYKNVVIEKNIDKYQISNISATILQENQEAEVTYEFEDIEPVSTRNILLSDFNESSLPVIGSVAIPDVEMLLPIYKGVSNEGMYLGATTLRDNIEMGTGNYSLGSHHLIDQELLFGPLNRVEYGQKIYLTDLVNIYTYEVSVIDVISPNRVDILDDIGSPIVTLLTCDISLENRLVIQGKLIEETPFDSTNKGVTSIFEITR